MALPHCLPGRERPHRLVELPSLRSCARAEGLQRFAASLHGITDGDNWFYYGRSGFSQGTGLGTLDVANFAAHLRGLIPWGPRNATIKVAFQPTAFFRVPTRRFCIGGHTTQTLKTRLSAIPRMGTAGFTFKTPRCSLTKCPHATLHTSWRWKARW